MCQEYKGNGRTVVGILRLDTRTCGTYLSLFGKSSALLPRVRRELAGSRKLGRRVVARHSEYAV